MMNTALEAFWRSRRAMSAGLRPVAVLFLAMSFAAILLGLGSVAGAQSTGEEKYTITDLGTLGGSDSSARAVNGSGHVVGTSSTDNDEADHAFLYENGSMADLGTIGGGDYSFGSGISDSGQVAGTSYIEGNFFTHAFLYDETEGMKDLGTPPGYNSTDASDVNDSGHVVGVAFGSGFRAFLYKDGAMTILDTLGGPNSGATGINDSGHVVGYSYTDSSGAYRAFLYKDGTMTDLGVLDGSSSSQATDINDKGQVVGASEGAGFTNRATLWKDGTVSEIVGLPNASSSYAASINNSGQVVGSSEMPTSHEEPPPGDGEIVPLSHESEWRSFVWQNGQTQDLNDLIDPASGWTLEQTNDINDEGQIVGTGTIDGQSHAFLLTPNTPVDTAAPTTTASSSPEPSAAGWNSSDVTVKLDATDGEGGSGVESITYSATGAQQIANQTVQGGSATVSITTEGETTITYFATDNAGNTEAEKTFAVKLDKTAPAGSVRINNGAKTTRKSTVKLTLSATDNEGGSGIGSMRFSNDGTNWSEWEPYATTRNWTLARGKGTRTVYAEFRDKAGNVLAPPAKDTIRRR